MCYQLQIKVVKWPLVIIWLLSGLLSITQTFSNFSPSILTEVELRQLTKELAPKVTLFSVAWSIDPEAEFFAGTTRDFLYWILRQFKDVKTTQQKNQKINELVQLITIDNTQFLGPDSDCDIISSKISAGQISAERFQLRKIDIIDHDRLNPKTPSGQSEIEQGHIPIEKMRLGRHGINHPDHFGNGVEEIISGDLSINLPDETNFWKTDYAKEGKNHPALLALRYLRLKGLDYFSRYGRDSDLPSRSLLKPEIQEKITDIFLRAATDPKFTEFIHNPRGQYFFNQTLLKSFRSHSHPEAMINLLKEVNFQALAILHPQHIAPINQFMFRKSRDHNKIQAEFKKWGVSESSIVTGTKHHIPELEVFHGTSDAMRYRSILSVGALPSDSDKTVGSGLYAVTKENYDIAQYFANGTDLIIKFSVNPTARIVDISDPNSAATQFFIQWGQTHGKDYDLFAETFGIDILKYHYVILGKTLSALCIKNSGVISGPSGLTPSESLVEKLIKRAQGVHSKEALDKLIKDLSYNNLYVFEKILVMNQIPKSFTDTLSINFKDLVDQITMEKVDIHRRLSKLSLSAKNADDIKFIFEELEKHTQLYSYYGGDWYKAVHVLSQAPQKLVFEFLHREKPHLMEPYIVKATQQELVLLPEPKRYSWDHYLDKKLDEFTDEMQNDPAEHQIRAWEIRLKYIFSEFDDWLHESKSLKRPKLQTFKIASRVAGSILGGLYGAYFMAVKLDMMAEGFGGGFGLVVGAGSGFLAASMMYDSYRYFFQEKSIKQWRDSSNPVERKLAESLLKAKSNHPIIAAVFRNVVKYLNPSATKQCLSIISSAFSNEF